MMNRLRIFLTACAAISSTSLPATEIIKLTPENYDQVVPVGKEVDANYGDWVLRNRHVVAVIANPREGRNANMTVRGVGGMLIDFTRRVSGSDQLSCFYPGGGRYIFDDAQSLVLRDSDGNVLPLSDLQAAKSKAITIEVQGRPLAGDDTTATVTYTLHDDQAWIDYAVTIANSGSGPVDFLIEDSLRCDGNLFRTASDDDLRLFIAEDVYFGQCYGFMFDKGTIKKQGGRNMQLRSSENAGTQKIAAGESRSWTGKVYCSQGLPSVRHWAKTQEEGRTSELQSLLLTFKSPQGPVSHARVEIKEGERSLGEMQSNPQGEIRCELLPGKYTAKIVAFGHEEREHEFEIATNARTDNLSFTPASRVRGAITDAAGKPIAAKVQFRGIDGTPDPDFGPDSAIAAIKNVVYCARGKFEQPLNPGKYEVIISHGPEYNADFQQIEVVEGKLLQVSSALPRVVDTNGWISSDFHSHSSPSGDNVSHQTGRVLNLLAEHIEFAPCTEHNRIDTYEDDLALLGATAAMATCTGMELTGSPLPINHQNAFPLHRHEHEQDGGGPTTSADPVKQIERLALWDNSSPKVVQTNHPNIPQILGDKDLDGQPDDGFRGMLGWMDVIEIHPPEGIFAFPNASVTPKDKGENPMFFWLQLLNLGYRIPGVVNTDAHYNFHGSGWLRNYMECSTDDPAKISIDEMIHSAEHGHMVMTTGPFLQAEVRVDGKSYIAGEDVNLESKPATLWMRVQCPNWFDVNRVQVFANGRPLDTLNFTRKTKPRVFSDSVVRFEAEVELPKFTEDTHLIVATIGEGLKLGPVMGAERGELPPVAVTNPVFLDVDGGGFQANGDDLGLPFMLPEIASEK